MTYLNNWWISLSDKNTQEESPRKYLDVAWDITAPYSLSLASDFDFMNIL